MGQLLLGRGLEGRQLNTLRVEQAEGVPHHPTLACCVHALQNHQDATSRVGIDASSGEEPLLQGRQLLAHLRSCVLGRLLVTGGLGGGTGVDRREIDRGLRAAQHIAQHAIVINVMSHASMVITPDAACTSVVERA